MPAANVTSDTSLHDRAFRLVCSVAAPFVLHSSDYDAGFVAAMLGEHAGGVAGCRRFLRLSQGRWFPSSRTFDPVRYVDLHRPAGVPLVHPLVSHALLGRWFGRDPGGRIFGSAGPGRGDDRAAGDPRLHIGAHVHVFHADIVPELGARLSRLPHSTSIIVTICTEAAPAELPAMIARHLPSAEIRRVPNCGRDIAPFLMLLREGAFRGVDLLLKVHTKKTAHFRPSPLSGAIWRRRALFELLGSAPAIDAIIARFAAAPSLGMIGPAGLRYPSLLYPTALAWGANEARTRGLARRLGIEDLVLDFFAGSMFWVRPQALEPLSALDFSFADFPIETGHLDGELHHAIERLFVAVAGHGGFSVEDTLALAPREPAGLAAPVVTLPEYLVFGDEAVARPPEMV